MDRFVRLADHISTFFAVYRVSVGVLRINREPVALAARGPVALAPLTSTSPPSQTGPATTRSATSAGLPMLAIIPRPATGSASAAGAASGVSKFEALIPRFLD